MVEFSDYMENQNLTVAAQILDHMRADLHQAEISLNFLLTMQRLQVTRRLQQYFQNLVHSL